MKTQLNSTQLELPDSTLSSRLSAGRNIFPTARTGTGAHVRDSRFSGYVRFSFRAVFHAATESLTVRSTTTRVSRMLISDCSC
jgi:hypothetical protein